MTALLEVETLSRRFGHGRGAVRAVNDVSFSMQPGEVLGVVGESGSGKSTLGRLVTRLIEPTAGRLRFDGTDIGGLRAGPMRRLRRDIQMVFQDPLAALNPRLTVGYQIEEPLKLHTDLDATARRARVMELADRIHLSAALLGRFPAGLSGGQLQRVCIARALATNPRLIVLDEPTSALDLSVRAGIIELLGELKRDLGIAMIFISHDLGTVRLVSDRILVLYLGTVVEIGEAATVFDQPQHPYTAALLSAHLSPDPREKAARVVLAGEIPSPVNLPPGCVFASRCPVALPACAMARPALEVTASGQHAACLRLPDATRLMLKGDRQ